MDIIFSIPEYATRTIHICTPKEKAFTSGKAIAKMVQLRSFLNPSGLVTFNFITPGFNFPDAFWEGLTQDAVDEYGLGILHTFVFRDSQTRKGGPEQYGFTRYKMKVINEASVSI